MPGTLAPMRLAPLALAVLLCLPALTDCYARRSISSDPPPAAVQSKAPPAEQKAQAEEQAPMQAAPAHEPAAKAKTAADAPAGQKAPAEEPAPAVPAVRQHYVQIGAFSTTMNALGAVSWLKGKGFEASRMVRVEQGQGTLFRVQAGPFQDLAAAHKALDQLKPDWPQAFIPGD